MSHFAKVVNGVVEQVIRIDQDTLNTGLWGNPNEWIQTSYNTFGNQHTLGGTPLRGNYAGIGSIYDSINDVFYAPSPYPSWVLNTSTWFWDAPIPKPANGKYVWDESNLTWQKIGD
jgi:hypothetical protein